MVTRVAAIALAVGASYDVYALNGRYARAAEQIVLSVLHHFGLM
jgi:hypothetical protein